MLKHESFVSIISKLTEDMAKYKAHRFSSSSNQLKKKLLGVMEKSKSQIEESIEVVSKEIKNLDAKCEANSGKINIKELLSTDPDKDNDWDDLNFLRGAVKYLQKQVREHAREKFIYSENFDGIIFRIPEYGEMSPEFPMNLMFLGIWEEDEMKGTDESEMKEICRNKLAILIGERRRIDKIFLTKLKLFVQVQKKLLAEIENKYTFLLNNSIDNVSTVKHFAPFCQRGYLNSLD